ncbi:MAG: TolC family protein, partial [Candidatus Omnitrophica bacterium]|nr:TolC family protein [Candidatus Omnitrophota bacterium]
GMRILKQILIFTIIIFASAQAWGEELSKNKNLSLSLNEAIQYAFQNNKEIKIKSLELDAGKAIILGARSNFLPKLNANLGYKYNGAVLNFGPLSEKKDMGIFVGYQNDNMAGISVDQIVYNGGANITQFNQAKLNLKIQEQTLKIQQEDVRFDAERLYYGALLASEVQKIAQNLVDLAQEHYEETEKKYEAGTVSRFDVLQSKVQVSKLKPQLIRSKTAVDLISAELRKLLGLKMDDTVILTDKLDYLTTVMTEKEAVKIAALNNPESILQLLGIDMEKLGIELAKASNRPQVNAGVNYGFHSNDVGDMFDDKHENWGAGVSVTIPIFDGFSSKAKVDEAKVRYAQSLLTKENLDDEIAVRVRRGILDLEKAQSLIDSQKDNIEEAREALRISQVRYDNGEGTNLDVLEAQVSLGQVEKNYSEGIFDYLIAVAFLSRTLGVDKDNLTNEKFFVKK